MYTFNVWAIDSNSIKCVAYQAVVNWKHYIGSNRLRFTHTSTNTYFIINTCAKVLIYSRFFFFTKFVRVAFIDFFASFNWTIWLLLFLFLMNHSIVMLVCCCWPLVPTLFRINLFIFSTVCMYVVITFIRSRSWPY